MEFIKDQLKTLDKELVQLQQRADRMAKQTEAAWQDVKQAPAGEKAGYQRRYQDLVDQCKQLQEERKRLQEEHKQLRGAILAGTGTGTGTGSWWAQLIGLGWSRKRPPLGQLPANTGRGSEASTSSSSRPSQIRRLTRAASVLNNWRVLGALSESVLPPSWVAPVLLHTSAPNFVEYWERHSSDYRTALQGAVIVKCLGERNRQQRERSHASEKALLQLIAGIMLELAGSSLKVTVLEDSTITPADGTQSAADLLVCLTPVDVEVDKSNCYATAISAVEVKREEDGVPIPSGMDDGTVEFLDLVEQARVATGAQQLAMAGAVSTGCRLRSITVVAEEGANDSRHERLSKAVYTSMLQLATTRAPGQPEDTFLVNPSSHAAAEKVYHLFLGASLHLQLRAAAEPQQLPLHPGDQLTLSPFSLCAPSGQDTSVTSRADQQLLQVTITGHSNGLLTACLGTDRTAVLLKLGHSAAHKALAVHLGCWEVMWQVERECVVRQYMKATRNIAPMVACGTIADTLLQDCRCTSSIAGRSVLLLQQTGVPLVPCDAQVLPVLDQHDSLLLLTCLLAAVLDINGQSIWHCDIRPENIGVNSSAAPLQRFYLYDFGAAACSAAALLARQVLPTCSVSCTAATHSCATDLQFASWEALAGKPLSATSDLQSAIFTVAALSGQGLPWSAAAAAGDYASVMAIRRTVAEQPVLLTGIAAWPADLQSMAALALRGDAAAAAVARHAVVAAVEQYGK